MVRNFGATGCIETSSNEGMAGGGTTGAIGGALGTTPEDHTSVEVGAGAGTGTGGTAGIGDSPTCITGTLSGRTGVAGSIGGGV